METGYFRCPNNHWVDFLPHFEENCPRCGLKWSIYLTEVEVMRKVGFFKPHRPVKDCDCSACKINQDLMKA